MIVEITPKDTPYWLTEKDYEYRAYDGDIEWDKEGSSFYDAMNNIFYPAQSFNRTHKNHVIMMAIRCAIDFARATVTGVKS
jgi:hypothetical protein